MKIFISYPITDEDLATKLKEILEQSEDIETAYIAQRVKKYDIEISNKIIQQLDDSDYLIAIITNDSISSASVNQELGYAQGISMPTIPLIEQNAKRGFLIYGKDVEEFTRANFLDVCSQIREHLKSIPKKRTKNEDKLWLLQNVYRPIYNSIIQIQNGNFFLTNKLVTPWEDIDDFSRFKMDKSIHDSLKELDGEIKKWNMMGRQLEREFVYKQHELGKIFKDCFILHEFFEKDMIKLSDMSWQPLHVFVEEFKEVLLFENLDSPEQLYEKMYAHSIQRDDDYHTILKQWKQRSGFQLFECLFKKISEGREFYKSEFVDIELLKRKNTIKKIATEIQSLLELKFQ
ncbi:hypothetical protein YTPLAS73_09580 [Nitrosarchaeum sp.]|nr:hypothetical protein YTPLAS73_09580 [Nitrosarchaeum sp.]